MPDAQQTTWANALHEQLPQLDVRTWRELAPQMAAMIDLGDAGVLIFAIVLMIALAFGVANTLISAVLERTREIGLLHVLGMARADIVGQVVLESLFIIGLGLIGGTAVGLLVAWWWRDGVDLTRWSAGLATMGIHSRIMLHVLWRDIANDTIVVLALGILGSLYPAWRAVRLAPLEALHGRKG